MGNFLLRVLADLVVSLIMAFFIWVLADSIGTPYDPTYLESFYLALLLVIVKDWLELNTVVNQEIKNRR